MKTILKLLGSIQSNYWGGYIPPCFRTTDFDASFAQYTNFRESKGKVLYYVYITKYHKIIHDTDIFFRILKRALYEFPTIFGNFLSGNAYSLKHSFQKDDQQNKKTKKIKLRWKILVGLQPIYLLNVLGMSSKSSCATLCHFKKYAFHHKNKPLEVS